MYFNLKSHNFTGLKVYFWLRELLGINSRRTGKLLGALWTPYTTISGVFEKPKRVWDRMETVQSEFGKTTGKNDK